MALRRWHGAARGCARRRVVAGSAGSIALVLLLASFSRAWIHVRTHAAQAWCRSAPLPGSISQRCAPQLPAGTAVRATGSSAPGTLLEPLVSLPLRRLELDDSRLVGAGYDLVDVRILTATGDPVVATFMLDSGLSTNLVTESFMQQLNLTAEVGQREASALGKGLTSTLQFANVPGIEILGSSASKESRFVGVWERDGWRALCSLDWKAWVEEAKGSDDGIVEGIVEWSVLPTPAMTEEQLRCLVGRRGTEMVRGRMAGDGLSFVGEGVSVEPKGFLAKTERFELRQEGSSLFDAISGMRLEQQSARPRLPLPGPVSVVCVPFAQEELARRQGIHLQGMLGQLPLYRSVALDLDPVVEKLRVYPTQAASVVAEASGLIRLPGLEISSGLVGISITHKSMLSADGTPSSVVPAMVDTGSATSILNWPAATQLLGIRPGDRIVRDSPIMRAVGVGGGQIDMPLITLRLGLMSDQRLPDGSPKFLQAKPVRAAIGDANIFEELFGREDRGSWAFGLGPRQLKPAALIGQDVLSQGRYLFAAGEPALYVAEQPPSWSGNLEFVGIGDCLDESGRRLQGLQKVATTPDEAAQACLEVAASSCRGIAVTPLTETRYQGLCYIFVDEGDEAAERLEERGWRRYSAPPGQSLAPAGAAVASANSDAGAECYAWRAAQT